MSETQRINDAKEDNNSLVLSYLNLRKSIGVIGTLLPFVLAIGNIWLDGPPSPSSVSAYYYGPMRDVFVGSLCAIGVFLGSYRGYDLRDAAAATLAAICAIGVALFPIKPEDTIPPPYQSTIPAADQTTIGYVHIAFAVTLLLTFAYFSLVLFRQTRTDDEPPTPRKRLRNKVYTVCGYTILVAIALSAAAYFFPAAFPINTPIFWFEALACVAFGISWFVKGEAILKDD